MAVSETQRCRGTAIELLSRREHSCQELTKKLANKDYPAEIVETITQDLVQEGVLSDERFVESFLRSRINKGYGPVRIRQELRERGVVDGLIAEAMAELSWQPQAAEARAKKFGNAVPVDYKEQARQMRFLQYRGFTTEQIRSVMKTDDWD